MRVRAFVLPLALAVAAVLPATAQSASKNSQMATPKRVTVIMKNAQGHDVGKVILKRRRGGVLIRFKLHNLPPGEHAVHIHSVARCDPPDFKTAGGHFNPTNKEHGFQNPRGHHAGDMPFDLIVRSNGRVHKTYFDRDVTMNPNAINSVFANGGTSIIIHARGDDMMSDPSGNAGARIACGVIQLPAAK